MRASLHVACACACEDPLFAVPAHGPGHFPMFDGVEDAAVTVQHWSCIIGMAWPPISRLASRDYRFCCDNAKDCERV